MGREIRRVPPDWQHPRDSRDHYVPLVDEDYETALAEWIAGRQKWQTEPENDCTWEDWTGSAPSPKDHRPAFAEGTATHYQIYETVSEGTPASPVFASKEAMGKWLLSEGYSRRATDHFLRAEWAPSMMMITYPDRPPTIYGPGISAFDAPD